MGCRKCVLGDGMGAHPMRRIVMRAIGCMIGKKMHGMCGVDVDDGEQVLESCTYYFLDVLCPYR